MKYFKKGERQKKNKKKLSRYSRANTVVKNPGFLDVHRNLTHAVIVLYCLLLKRSQCGEKYTVTN